MTLAVSTDIHVRDDSVPRAELVTYTETPGHVTFHPDTYGATLYYPSPKALRLAIRALQDVATAWDTHLKSERDKS